MRAIGRLGFPLFSAVRASPLGELAEHARAYREAWAAAGHKGRARMYLQAPVYVAESRERALEEARDGMMRFSSYRADLLRGPLSYDEVLREKGIVGTPDMVIDRLTELRETAGLDGVSAEINPGSMLSHEQVMAVAAPVVPGGHAAVQVTGRARLRAAPRPPGGSRAGLPPAYRDNLPQLSARCP